MALLIGLAERKQNISRENEKCPNDTSQVLHCLLMDISKHSQQYCHLDGHGSAVVKYRKLLPDKLFFEV